MKIKRVSAKTILDSRQEKTISISIETNVGIFLASSPTGKSTGKYEKKPYKKSLEGDIKSIKDISDYFSCLMEIGRFHQIIWSNCIAGDQLIINC